MPSSGRNDFLQTVYERHNLKWQDELFCACIEKLRCENRYIVYVSGVNAECIERLRCGSSYIVYNFRANGACMEIVRFGISRGVGCENDNHDNGYCEY